MRLAVTDRVAETGSKYVLPPPEGASREPG